MSRTFTEFRESDKSMKHELRSIQRPCLSHMSCWCCASILVSYTRLAGSSPFTVMTNRSIFVTEFSEFSETFRKNFIEWFFSQLFPRILHFSVSNIWWTQSYLISLKPIFLCIFWEFFFHVRCKKKNYARWDSIYARSDWREVRFNEPPKWLYIPWVLTLREQITPPPPAKKNSSTDTKHRTWTYHESLHQSHMLWVTKEPTGGSCGSFQTISCVEEQNYVTKLSYKTNYLSKMSNYP